MTDQEPRCTLHKREDVEFSQTVQLPQAPCQDDGKSDFIQLNTRPIRSAVDPEVLRKTAVWFLGAGEVHQGPPCRIDAIAGQKCGGTLHHVTGPHQVVAAYILIAFVLSPGDGS